LRDKNTAIKVESGAFDSVEVHEVEIKTEKDNDGNSKHNNGSAIKVAPGALEEIEIEVRIKEATVPTKIASGAFDGNKAKVHEVDNKDGKDNSGNAKPNEASVNKLGSGGLDGPETKERVGRGKLATNPPDAPKLVPMYPKN
jgi:hypothetical protein